MVKKDKYAPKVSPKKVKQGNMNKRIRENMKRIKKGR